MPVGDERFRLEYFAVVRGVGVDWRSPHEFDASTGNNGTAEAHRKAGQPGSCWREAAGCCLQVEPATGICPLIGKTKVQE